MRHRSRASLLSLLAALVAFALGAAACGSSDDSAEGSASGASGTDAGSVFVSGSSTVEPISVRVAELFDDVDSSVNVTVEGPGTGDGFKKFCAGESDISDASRMIKDSEAEDCAANGIDYVELRVGIDGIAVLTNAANTVVDCVTFEDLYALIGPEAIGFGSWSDANDLAAELGSGSAFPDASLDISAPGTESGTYDSFVEIVLEGIGEARFEAGVIAEDEAATTRPDYASSADDSIIIANIEGSDSALGWVGFAFAAEASEAVKLLEVDGGDGCVAATPDTIASGEYPVSRSLYIYVNAASADENPGLAAYVDFYMSDEGLGQAVSAVGYVELTDDQKAETRAVWNAR